MNGGVQNKGFNEQLRDILDKLEQDINLLNNPDYIQHIMFLLQAGADPNTKGQDEKTLSYYLDEKLFNILNELAINSNLLDDSNYTQYIMFLLGAGANPNIQNQDGKTLLHYVAERNDTNGIGFLLKAGADPNVQDRSEKTPFEYVTEHNCLQALKDLDDSYENEGNPATPDSSVGERNDCSNSSGDDSQIESVKLSDCNTEEDSDYYSDDSRENEGNSTTPDGSVDDCSNSSGDDNKTISTEPSDCDPEDEDSSCSSSDYLFLEDSLLAKLEIPLTTDEQELIDKFCEEIRGMTAQNKQESEENILESIEKIVDEYLKEGIRLNSSCSDDNEKDDKETVTNFILEEIEDVLNNRVKLCDGTKEYIGRVNDITDQDDDNEDKVSGIIENITNKLLLKGGKARQKFFFSHTDLAQDYGSNYINNLSKECEEIESKLISIAYEGIVNKSKQIHEYGFEAEIDNKYFYIKYPQDSIIEPVKIFNKAEALNLKVGILQIGESIVRVESIDGKRNYTDVLKGSIKMSFTTEGEKISIYLSPSKEGGNKIKVEIDEENKAKFNKLKDKSSLGKDCLLEGENVSEVISKNFKMSDSVSTELTETTKDVPFTDFTQACSQQIDTSVKGLTIIHKY